MTSVLAERLSRAIAFICAAILYITFGVIFLILCSDVILRYFAGSSLQWASEIPELLFPWLVMAGVVLAAQHGAHIATTFLADAVPGKVRKVLSVIGHVAIIAAYALLAVVAAQQIPIVADERLLVELPKKGVKIDKVDQSQFQKATQSVTAKWEGGPIGDYVKKVVAAARTK